MKLADYVIDFVVSLGVREVFTVTGGAIAHVVDAVGRRHQEKGDIDFVCVQHEQSGAMAAEVYSRLGPGPGVVLVTSGPGATNLITGICGAWFDSIPCIFISGQVNTKESLDSISQKPRQVGFQETDIVSMVKSITKFAEKVTDPNKIRYTLEKAWHIANAGRPGPVLVDIPVDVQITDIDPAVLIGFQATEEKVNPPEESDESLTAKINQLLGKLTAAKRPVILLGGGVRLARAEEVALKLVQKLQIPTVVSWSGFDLIAHNHPQFVGHIGVYGSRGANFAIQNADFLLSLGSRLDTRQTGGKRSTFARDAFKALVDIDAEELYKGRGMEVNLGFQCDVGRFFKLLESQLNNFVLPDIKEWQARALAWRNKYPACLPEYLNQPNINAYAFLDVLSKETPENETVIVDEGGNLVWTMQAWQVKSGQRVISTFGNSPMGYALPAAIGASLALGKKSVICIDGDGGFQMNVQELQTVVNYNLPLKIFILNNRGYGIIKQFQDLYFNSRYEATGRGYSAPDFKKVAEAYGVPAITISSPQEIAEKIKWVLNQPGPVLCNVLIDENQKLTPKLEFGRPIEDLTPYLSDEEFASNMIVKSLPRQKENKGWQNA